MGGMQLQPKVIRETMSRASDLKAEIKNSRAALQEQIGRANTLHCNYLKKKYETLQKKTKSRPKNSRLNFSFLDSKSNRRSPKLTLTKDDSDHIKSLNSSNNSRFQSHCTYSPRVHFKSYIDRNLQSPTVRVNERLSEESSEHDISESSRRSRQVQP